MRHRTYYPQLNKNGGRKLSQRGGGARRGRGATSPATPLTNPNPNHDTNPNPHPHLTLVLRQKAFLP